MKSKILIVVNALMLMTTITIKAQTAQTRTFTFTEASHSSTYNGNAQHDLAVWVEQGSGTAGTFVVTKLRYVGGGTNDHLPNWASKASCTSGSATSTGCNTATATTGATLSAWATRTVTWDGKNAAGTLVADGNYQFVVQSTWNHGTAGTAIRYFPFVKGPGAPDPTFASDTNFTGISAVLSSSEFSLKPEVSIYPNPTNGIVNMDFKNNVNAIKIINILGKVVYNEKITEDLTNMNKRIDLSNLVGGIYIVSVSNDNGTSNYKVVLNK